MGVPRRFVAPNDCLNCSLRQKGDFCHLPDHLLESFNLTGHLTLYPAGAMLLREGQIPRGVYIICSGRAKLSLEARDNKTVILKIADRRQLIGLSAIVSNRPSPMTVTTLETSQVKYIERDSFLSLLQQDARALLTCATMIAQEVVGSFDDVHELLMARSSTEKLARLLLSWVAGETHNQELRVAANFTHEEIAQMIGSSRETVTRLFSDMRRKELIRLEGSTLVIPNRVALQALA